MDDYEVELFPCVYVPDEHDPLVGVFRQTWRVTLVPEGGGTPYVREITRCWEWGDCESNDTIEEIKAAYESPLDHLPPANITSELLSYDEIELKAATKHFTIFAYCDPLTASDEELIWMAFYNDGGEECFSGWCTSSYCCNRVEQGKCDTMCESDTWTKISPPPPIP